MTLQAMVVLVACCASAAAAGSLFVDTVPKVDTCGVCDGMDMSCVECTSFIDCNGACGGSALVDDCGICGGDSASCTGCLDPEACNLNVYATIDDRSVCTYGSLDSKCVLLSFLPRRF